MKTLQNRRPFGLGVGKNGFHWICFGNIIKCYGRNLKETQPHHILWLRRRTGKNTLIWDIPHCHIFHFEFVLLWISFLTIGGWHDNRIPCNQHYHLASLVSQSLSRPGNLGSMWSRPCCFPGKLREWGQWWTHKQWDRPGYSLCLCTAIHTAHCYCRKPPNL